MKLKYKSKSEVKIGDLVYIAKFIDDGNGGRIACSIELVVHSVDDSGNVAVRNSHWPNVPFYANAEWTPCWSALAASDEDALTNLHEAASHGLL